MSRDLAARRPTEVEPILADLTIALASGGVPCTLLAGGRPGRWLAVAGAMARRQAVVVLVNLLGLGAGGLPVPGAREEPPGAERPDVGGRVWLQALQDVLGQAR